MIVTDLPHETTLILTLGNGDTWRLTYGPGDEISATASVGRDLIRGILTVEESVHIATHIGRLAACRAKGAA